MLTLRHALLFIPAWLFSLAATAQPPVLFPANHTQGVCPDTLLKLTFPTPPALGIAGQIHIYDASDNHLVDTVDVTVPAYATSSEETNGGHATSVQIAACAAAQSYTIGGADGFHLYPVIINGNVAIIYPHHHALDYHKTYYVEMDSGVLYDRTGPFAGFNGSISWSFSTKDAPPAADSPRLVVADDGSGDFATVQGALDFIPIKNTRRVTLFIQPGNYTEIVFFADKSNITFLGADRQQTVIGYANNNKFNTQPNTSEKPGEHFYYRSSFMGNHVTGIQLVNLTLKNTTPKNGSQAEALILVGGQNILDQVNLSSRQDTLQINDSAYVADSYIEGDVDFMWGRGPVFFQNCILYSLNPGYYTQIRNTDANHGFVYVGCHFDGAANPKGTFLSRIDPAVYPNSEVVLLNCALGANISPVAWILNNASTAPDVHFWEYNSINVADGKPADISNRAPFSKQLTLPQDAVTIANYSDPAFVLGGWTPAMAPIITAQPDAGPSPTKVMPSGPHTVILKASVAGVPTPVCQWFFNGTLLKDSGMISGATTNTLILKSSNSQEGIELVGRYSLKATNAAGFATSNGVNVIMR